MSKVKDYLIEKQGSIDESTLEECEDCGRTLPPPKMEKKETCMYELVTYCPCGATYYG